MCDDLFESQIENKIKCKDKMIYNANRLNYDLLKAIRAVIASNVSGTTPPTKIQSDDLVRSGVLSNINTLPRSSVILIVRL
jgi:hypothetical protein